MDNRPPPHAIVALLEDVDTTRFESDEPLLLQCGDMGTVVMVYDDGACNIEFSDRSGRTYAMLSVSGDRLLVLRDAPEHAGI
jgi:hypothetical protein